jgi:hypothetical protein
MKDLPSLGGGCNAGNLRGNLLFFTQYLEALLALVGNLPCKFFGPLELTKAFHQQRTLKILKHMFQCQQHQMKEAPPSAVLTEQTDSVLTLMIFQMMLDSWLK